MLIPAHNVSGGLLLALQLSTYEKQSNYLLSLPRLKVLIRHALLGFLHSN